MIDFKKFEKYAQKKLIDFAVTKADGDVEKLVVLLEEAITSVQVIISNINPYHVEEDKLLEDGFKKTLEKELNNIINDKEEEKCKAE